MHLGETLCKTPEDFKAWSQNLGHEGVLTTFCSYGQVGSRRQGEIIQGLAEPRRREPSDADEIAEAVWRKLNRSGRSVWRTAARAAKLRSKEGGEAGLLEVAIVGQGFFDPVAFHDSE